MMQPSETADLLAMMAAYDRRTIGAADVAAWHRELADIPAADASAAVIEHYATTREWAMPADILGIVRRIRRERLTTAGDPPVPPVDGDDVPRYLEWIGHWRDGIASGLSKDDADRYADQRMGITRTPVEARPRPVAELVAAVAATSRIPRRDQAAATGPTRHVPEGDA